MRFDSRRAAAIRKLLGKVELIRRETRCAQVCSEFPEPDNLKVGKVSKMQIEEC